jgi:hypothetical protein
MSPPLRCHVFAVPVEPPPAPRHILRATVPREHTAPSGQPTRPPQGQGRPRSYPEYDDLLAQAAAVRRLPFSESTSESHMAASKLMIDAADELHAVWDGDYTEAVVLRCTCA